MQSDEIKTWAELLAWSAGAVYLIVLSISRMFRTVTDNARAMLEAQQQTISGLQAWNTDQEKRIAQNKADSAEDRQKIVNLTKELDAAHEKIRCLDIDVGEVNNRVNEITK